VSYCFRFAPQLVKASLPSQTSLFVLLLLALSVGFPLAQRDKDGQDGHPVSLPGAFKTHGQNLPGLEAHNDSARAMLENGTQSAPPDNFLQICHEADTLGR
jgi:hypothetical protein